MHREQIARFLRAVYRLEDLYTEQRKLVYPAGGCGGANEVYQISDHWQRIFSRDPIQTRFFEPLHRLGPQAGYRG